MTTLVEAKNVSKTFQTKTQDVRALISTDVTVQAGEFVTCVGPSGSGKTTLLNVLAGLERPTTGEVRVSGELIDGPRPDSAVVFQQPILLPWFNVIKNVLMPVSVHGSASRADKERARELLALVGLSDFAQNYPYELSGGMAQRTGLARGLIRDPEIVYFDEPFAALDALTREHLMVELARIWQVQQKAAFFITHNIAEAVFLGDRVLVMSAAPGRIKEEIEIPFPRPRRIELLGSPEFLEFESTIRALLTAEEEEESASATGAA